MNPTPATGFVRKGRSAMSDTIVKIWSKAVERVPGTMLALLIIVGLFLWFIDNQNKIARQFVEDQAIANRQVAADLSAANAEHLKRRDEIQDRVFTRMAQSIEKNVEATSKNTAATSELTTRFMMFIDNERRK